MDYCVLEDGLVCNDCGVCKKLTVEQITRDNQDSVE
jgi:hypothetical protein